ncbi:MAG: hypothetical protein LBJ95_02245 [Oscillospiraceae bacterium]|jgi:hypothetical protein|nr:hypothetical protein [Oscillospiraceae bacterium]
MKFTAKKLMSLVFAAALAGAATSRNAASAPPQLTDRSISVETGEKGKTIISFHGDPCGANMRWKACVDPGYYNPVLQNGEELTPPFEFAERHGRTVEVRTGGCRTADGSFRARSKRFYGEPGAAIDGRFTVSGPHQDFGRVHGQVTLEKTRVLADAPGEPSGLSDQQAAVEYSANFDNDEDYLRYEVTTDGENYTELTFVPRYEGTA